MKIRKIGDTPKAVRIFTDREEPRAAFWAMYEKASEQMGSDDADVHVISYYGIGGIGKSRLLKQLRVEMDEKIAKPYYAEIDFETGRECREALEHLKNKLAERYKFSFPMFELCSYAYSQKIGENPEAPKVKGFIEKSPLLKTVFTAGGFVPGLDVVTSVLTAADETVAAFRGSIQKNKTELLKLREMSAEDIYKQLPVYFAKDMLHNMQKLTSPLVVFVDTYERLVNELEQIGDPLKNDVWLRGENGVIQNIPGVLWVIAGREKLKWQKFDADWEQALEQHMLGNLSFADSSGFLSEAGITDATLQKYIYKLTDGTPVYLDLCVDQYEALLEKGITPEEELFGKNTEELVERFIRYMNDTQKDMVYMLVCMGRWKDSIISAKGAQILPGFSLSTYEKTKELSVVVALDNGECAFHQTVGEVLFKNMPDIIRKTIGEKLIEIHRETLESHDFFGDGYADALFYTARGGMALYTDREEFRTFYEDTIEEYFLDFADSGMADTAVGIIEMLLYRFRGKTDDELYLLLLGDTAHVLKNQGGFDEAYEIQKEVLEKSKVVNGENHPTTLTAMGNLTYTLGVLGKSDEADALKKIVIKKSKVVFGENDSYTLTSMHNLALTLGELGKHKEACEIQKEVLEKSKVVNGENHPKTLKAMNILASTLWYMGKCDEAWEIEKEVIEKSKIVFGENHPETLIAMDMLVETLEDHGRHTETCEIQKEVLEKRKVVFGENHPITLLAMSDLASTLGKLGKHDEACEIQKEVLEKSKAVNGENHLDTLIAMNKLASTLGKLGKHDEACEIQEEVLEKMKAVHGENHPDTLLAMNILACTLSDMGEYGEAFKIQKEVLEKSKVVLGENDPITLLAMNGLACILSDMAEYG